MASDNAGRLAVGFRTIACRKDYPARLIFSKPSSDRQSPSNVSVLNSSPCVAPVERLGCRRLGDLLGYDFGLCFALGCDSGGGQIGGLLGGGIVRQLLEDFGQVILGIESLGAAVGE